MRLTVLVMSGLLAVSSVAHAQNTPVIAGGPHDFSNGSAVRNSNTTIDGQTCVFCHTPHGGSNSIPLWNRNAPSGDLSALHELDDRRHDHLGAAGQQRLGRVPELPRRHHRDGRARPTSTAWRSRRRSPSRGRARRRRPTASTGGGGSNVMSGGPAVPRHRPAQRSSGGDRVRDGARGEADRVRDAGASTARRSPSGGASRCRCSARRTANATVECASCHDAHNNTLGNFLRKANTGSAMCLTCHIK